MILSWLFNRVTTPLWRAWDDPGWQPTGYRLRTEATYDEDKAVSGRLRALERAKAARKVADQVSRAARRQAAVVDIRRAR